MGATSIEIDEHPKLSWREGLFLVGPDPLTSPYYSSGALIVAGAGYATPGFQLGLYALLFLLAPLYIEAVLLTLSNGGTYVMTRYALSHLGKWAIVAAAIVGVVISFSYVATAIVSLLSYSDYVLSLFGDLDHGRVAAGVTASMAPAVGFGVWVMPKQWRRTTLVVVLTSMAALVLSTLVPGHVVVMLAPLVLLLLLNNYGLRESVRVSRTIFLINLVVMVVTILMGVVYLVMHGADFGHLIHGADVPSPPQPTDHGSSISWLPGFGTLQLSLIPAALGSSILGASVVESVMNIPEELRDPRRDVRRIYMWMLSVLAVIGGSIALLIFLVLPPEKLVGHSAYLVAVLGSTSVEGVTGSHLLGEVWHLVIVTNAALMLIGATNTAFAAARGLWVTMARDNLLPRLALRQNARGVYENIHWMMLVAILVLCGEASANSEILERWYGATFGLVMFSGVIAFFLLRRFKADDRRAYVARPNVTLGGVSVPVSAIIGGIFLILALLGLYAQYQEQIGTLRRLLTVLGFGVIAALLAYNHRPIIRRARNYLIRVVETVEQTELETDDRSIVVAVGGARMGALIPKAIGLARAQSSTTGVPYRRLIAFHMTPTVSTEHVYRVTRGALTPTGIDNSIVHIFNQLSEHVVPDLDMYLVLVPNHSPGSPPLKAAMDALVEFHQRHGFAGHIVCVGDYGLDPAALGSLAERLSGSTLVPIRV